VLAWPQVLDSLQRDVLPRDVLQRTFEVSP